MEDSYFLHHKALRKLIARERREHLSNGSLRNISVCDGDVGNKGLLLNLYLLSHCPEPHGDIPREISPLFALNYLHKECSFSELEVQLKKEISESSKRVISDFFSAFFKQFPAEQRRSINLCPKEIRQFFLYGSSSKQALNSQSSDPNSSSALDSKTEGQNQENAPLDQSTGLLSILENLFLRATSPQEKKYWASLRSPVECPECHGARISKVARHVSIQGKTFFDLTSMNISQLNEWFSNSLKLNEAEIDKLGSQLEQLFFLF